VKKIMASLLLNMNIKITEVDEFMQVAKCIIALTDQIEGSELSSEFTDKHGHKIEMNKSYIDLKESIHKFNEVLAKCNKYELVDMSK